MALRKAGAYSKKIVRPYSRKSRNKSKAYIKTVPNVKTVKFFFGNQKDYNEGKHPFIIRLISEEKGQIRDNAIEACRIYLAKIFEKEINNQFFLAIKIYPHHLQRENKCAGGVAGADRISTGMTQSFGIVISRAAIVEPKQELFFISCANEKAARIAKNALMRIKSKIPTKTKVIFEKI